MTGVLSDIHQERYNEFCDFVKANVEPHAGEWDREGRIPGDIIGHIGKTGYFGAIIPVEYGGKGWDHATFGLLNEAFGRGSSSLTVLFTVQNMVAASIMKWGREDQKERWIRPMANGDIIAAFALTEPDAGSDIGAIKTQFSEKDGIMLLNGTKRYITFAEIADIYLVFGYREGKSMACIVGKEMPGVKVTAMKEMLGFRSCHLAQLDFTNVEVPCQNVIGKEGFAISHVAPVGLHCGRLSTAFSSVGLIRACLETTIDRAAHRTVSGEPLLNLAGIRNIIAEIGVSYETSLLVCLNAARAEDERSAIAIERTITAKYIASKNAVKAANNAVQVCGAAGCHESSLPTGRYYRDSKIMEIIEGTSQVLQNLLETYYLNQYKPAFGQAPMRSAVAV